MPAQKDHKSWNLDAVVELLNKLWGCLPTGFLGQEISVFIDYVALKGKFLLCVAKVCLIDTGSWHSAPVKRYIDMDCS